MSRIAPISVVRGHSTKNVRVEGFKRVRAPLRPRAAPWSASLYCHHRPLPPTMHLLGHHLPDHKLLRVRSFPLVAHLEGRRSPRFPLLSPLQVALTSFYGVSHHTSALILARLQIHQGTIVSSLTEPQVTALSAYLSSPSTTQRPAACPVAPPGGIGARGGEGSARAGPSTAAGAGKGKERALDMGDAPLMLLREQDRLDTLKIETDLRRSMQSDIAHQRSIGTYRGRRCVGRVAPPSRNLIISPTPRADTPWASQCAGKTRATTPRRRKR